MEIKNTLTEELINPTILEAIKQPLSKIKISSYLSLDMWRNGRKYFVTIYADEKGQVNISDCNKHGWVRNVIITDYCKTKEDLANLFENLDDLAIRMPDFELIEPIKET